MANSMPVEKIVH